MAVTNRFLFDTEFGSESASRKAAAKPVEREEAVFTESDVAALKAEAFENGLREGQGRSLEGIETAIAGTMGTISHQLKQLLDTHDAKINTLKQEAASLALVLASKLAPALIELAPDMEVRKLIEECLADLHDEPRIVIRANDDICQRIAEKIDDITSRAGFQGNIILLPDDEAAAGDCRVEWADGGTERRLSDIQHRLDEVISRFIRSAGPRQKNTADHLDQPIADQV